jgi:hypothetical protein
MTMDFEMVFWFETQIGFCFLVVFLGFAATLIYDTKFN